MTTEATRPDVRRQPSHRESRNGGLKVPDGHLDVLRKLRKTVVW
jgi:hypothetical protein